MSGWFPPGVPRLDLYCAGRTLLSRRYHNDDLYFECWPIPFLPQMLFALVIARIECLFVPFVTILEVFTFIALSRESVKALFSAALATIPTARRTARRRNNTIAVQQISEERSDLLPSSATVKFCQRDPAAAIY